MVARTRCPHCDTRLRLKNHVLARSSIRCPKCGEDVAVADLELGDHAPRPIPLAHFEEPEPEYAPRPRTRRRREAFGFGGGLVAAIGFICAGMAFITGILAVLNIISLLTFVIYARELLVVSALLTIGGLSALSFWSGLALLCLNFSRVESVRIMAHRMWAGGLGVGFLSLLMLMAVMGFSPDFNPVRERLRWMPKKERSTPKTEPAEPDRVPRFTITQAQFRRVSERLPDGTPMRGPPDTHFRVDYRFEGTEVSRPSRFRLVFRSNRQYGKFEDFEIGRQGTIQCRMPFSVLSPPFTCWLEWTESGDRIGIADDSWTRVSDEVTMNPVDVMPADVPFVKLPRQGDDEIAALEREIARTHKTVDPAPGDNPNAKPRRPRETEMDTADLVAQLQSVDSHERDKALDALQKRKPDEHRAQVETAVCELFDRDDRSQRDRIVRVLAIWGTEQSVPTLIAHLGDGIDVNREVIALLGRLGDRRAAGPLAALLPEFFGSKEAKAALINLGPACEEEVAAYLKHPEPRANYAALEILQKVGTQKSVAPLRALLKRPRLERRDRALIEEAIGMIERRAKDEAAVDKP